MGPYCKFCGGRCFVWFLEDDPKEMIEKYGSIGLMATCPEGQAFERKEIGYCYSDVSQYRKDSMRKDKK